MKNVVEVLGVGDGNSGVTVESLKSKNKLKPKKNIQDLWSKKVDWDETIPHQLLAQ